MSNIKRLKNTKKKGLIEFLFYKSGDSHIGVCLTFNIIEENSNLGELKNSLIEAAKLHVEIVTKNNLSDDLLNRYAPQIYWDRYLECMKGLAKKEAEQKGCAQPFVLQIPTLSPCSI